MYTRNAGRDEGEIDTAQFLPEIREKYKYLGLEQLDTDSKDNYDNITKKMEETVGKIMRSELSASQKITLLNTTAIPAVDYVTANIYAKEKRATSLKRCREMDSRIRKILVEERIKGRTTSNAGVYMSRRRGGLGLKSVEHVAELNYVRKGIYTIKHENMGDTRRRYEALKKAGWRNPISDMEYVLNKYQMDVDWREEEYGKLARTTTKEINKKYQENLAMTWTSNMLYGRVVMEEEEDIKFPAYESPMMDD